MTPESRGGVTPSFAIAHPREAELVGRARAGDREAFGELIGWYATPAVAAAVRLVGVQDGPDAAQDAFVRAFRAISAYRGAATFGIWLRRVVRSTAIDHRRRRRSRPVTRSIDGVDERRLRGIWQDPSSRVDPERVVERAAVRSILTDAMERLSDPQRTVLILHDVQGATSREIAETLAMPLPTVKSHLRRARTAMVKAVSAARSRWWP